MPQPPPTPHEGHPLLVGIVGPSGVGKTTLIEGVVARLSADGLAVGAVKHSGHAHPLQPPGTDSGRLLAAGARAVAFVTPAGWVTARPTPPTVADVAAAFAGMDLVLVEGWTGAGLPCLGVARAACPDPTWAAPPGVVAWAADQAPPTPLPHLPLAPEAVARALRRWWQTGRPPGA